MMEKLLFQERILIHRPCFWWIWSLVVQSILVRWHQDLPVKMWRRWLTNGTRENSKKNLTWKGRRYEESEADIAGISLHSWHYAFLWGAIFIISHQPDQYPCQFQCHYQKCFSLTWPHGSLLFWYAKQQLWTPCTLPSQTPIRVLRHKVCLNCCRTSASCAEKRVFSGSG